MVRGIPLFLALLLAAVLPLAGQEGMSGSVHAVDGGPVAGVWVHGECGGARDSARVGSGGAFRLEGACAGGARSLELVDPDGRYLPTVARLRPRVGGGDPAVLLVPRAWRIESGTHQGEVVGVDLAGATTVPCRGCASFYAPEDTILMRPRGIPVWLESALPLRVAFSKDDGVIMSERDSLAFMQVAEALETDLGRRWFQPASEEQVFDPASERFGSIIVSIDPGLPTAGRGNWAAQAGEIVAGVIYLQSAALIRDHRNAGIVAHELMHALGFGHTCSWRTVVAADRCPGRRADAPTPDDVAHAQLLLRLRTLERHYGIYGTVAATLAGMRKHPVAPPVATPPASARDTTPAPSAPPPAP